MIMDVMVAIVVVVMHSHPTPHKSSTQVRRSVGRHMTFRRRGWLKWQHQQQQLVHSSSTASRSADEHNHQNQLQYQLDSLGPQAENVLASNNNTPRAKRRSGGSLELVHIRTVAAAAAAAYCCCSQLEGRGSTGEGMQSNMLRRRRIKRQGKAAEAAVVCK